jgi:flavin reductase (DIM6/NTAB) family NADH-FMN oxidoreductase RutF
VSTAVAVTARDLRTLLRRHAAGVTVVTTVDGRGAPVGLTVSSFTPVSLEPPLVSFCVGYTASARPALESAPGFAVHVLGAGQAELAGRFATSGVDRFAGLDWWPGDDGLPRLPGALTWLACTTEVRQPAGDHLLILGRVRAAAAGPGGPPLLHHDGRLVGLPVPLVA